MFGKIGGFITGAVDPRNHPAAQIAMGKGPLARMLGLSGGQGEYFQPIRENKALDAIDLRNAVSGKVAGKLSDYGQGKMSLSEALAASGLSGDELDEYQQLLATDPMSGSRFATEQVMNNPILGQLYGKGGALERALAEEQELASRGYKLQPEDHEAYGQASGEIARLFGQQEQALAQALADRGLSAAPSGAAQVQFSGLAGNKNEMLAASQRDIAQKRMDMNRQRLRDVRQHYSGLGSQAQSAIQDQFGRQMEGAQFKRGGLENAAQMRNAANYGLNDAMYKQMLDKRESKGKTLMDAFGRGLFKTAEAAPGAAASAATGAPMGG